MRNNYLLFALFCFYVFSVKNVSAQWSELGNTSPSSDNIHIDEQDNIYLSGIFYEQQGKYNIIRNFGNYWGQLGGKLNGLNANNYIKDICTDQFNNVYAAGFFTNKSGNRYVAKYDYDGNAWYELGGYNSLAANGYITTICSDKMGNIYAAGTFKNKNGKYYVAKWDGQRWSELGGSDALSANAPIKSITIDLYGKLYAAGAFENKLLGTGSKFVAVWDGKSWEELGGSNSLTTLGFIGEINSICSDDKGNIYAAGELKSNSFYFVAKWDGNNWTKLGGQNAYPFNNEIYSLNHDKNGNLYVGGDFKNNNGKQFVAKWDGIKWVEFQDKNQLVNNIGIISCIKLNSKGEVFITASNLSNDNGRFSIAKWDSESWTAFGGTNFSPLQSWYSSMICDDYGDIYLSGGGGGEMLSMWNGISWVVLDNLKYTFSSVRSMTVDKNNRLYIAGRSIYKEAIYIKRWNGVNWEVLGNDTNLILGNIPEVRGMCTDNSFNVYLIGNFYNSKGQYVAKWDGNNLTQLGELQVNNNITTICKDLSENIYVSGVFKNASGNNYVAKWDGNKWSELGGANSLDVNGGIFSITIDKSGNVYISAYSNGKPYIAKWDGNKWNELGGSNNISNTLNVNGYVTCVALDSKENLIVAGNVYQSNSGELYIAKWNGQNWIELKSINSLRRSLLGISHLGIDKFDNIYAPLTIKNSSRTSVVKWNNCESVINIQPQDINSNINSNVILTVNSVDVNSKFQWQIDTGFGYSNVINSNQFKGATNDTLSIDNLNLFNNNQLFRCQISTGYCKENSQSSIIKINPNLSLDKYKKIKINAYPNPTSNSISINVKSELIGEKYFIFSSTGELVSQGLINSITSNIDLSHLNTGLFYIKIGVIDNDFVKVVKR